jgi:glycerol-1-phosphate dehydrogenase [NAD(P)+]
MAEIDRILSDDLLGRSFDCACGLGHHVPTRRVIVEDGVVDNAPDVLPELVAGNRVSIVADTRTWSAAGESFHQAVRDRYQVSTCIVPDDASGHVHASVELVDELTDAVPDSFDFYAAVGSGTINDITKELAHRRGRPYIAVATAASMNGYTSSIVALLEGGLKTTSAATPPVALLADPGVLSSAPVELSLAGLGDLLSKPYCGCDWWIASTIRNERYCPMPGRLLNQAFDEALEELPGVGTGDPDAIVLLVKLLAVSGITMTIAGTSSPASGGEHLVSHYWDMVNLREGRPIRLHGAQVGVASVAMDALYTVVLETDFSSAQLVPNPDPTHAEAEIQHHFGSLAPAVLPEWQAKLAERTDRDLALLQRHEAAIKAEIADVLKSGREVRRTLKASGAPMWAADLGISREELVAALRHGRKIRTRFTVLDIAAELGLLEAFARHYPSSGG